MEVFRRLEAVIFQSLQVIEIKHKLFNFNIHFYRNQFYKIFKTIKSNPLLFCCFLNLCLALAMENDYFFLLGIQVGFKLNFRIIAFYNKLFKMQLILNPLKVTDLFTLCSCKITNAGPASSLFLFVCLSAWNKEYTSNITNLIAWTSTLHLIVHLCRCRCLYCFTVRVFWRS